MRVAFDQLHHELLSEEDAGKLGRLDDETTNSIQINLTEWVLAEGHILVKGIRRRVSDYLIGPDGPALAAGQGNWLQQMAQRSLRLYDVTDVVPGVQMTLCDALESEAAPIVVRERSGTRKLVPGAQAVADRWRATVQEFGHLPDLAGTLALTVLSAWLQQFVVPAPMPTFIDAHSGEPLLLITDHYRVLDWHSRRCSKGVPKSPAGFCGTRLA